MSFFTELDDGAVRDLATLTVAMADGLFIATEISGDAVDLLHQFETLAAAVLAASDRLANRSKRSRK
jgi:predicted regulator of Ras-like GTPase activity (Roadblock/LC7/MglB family)